MSGEQPSNSAESDHLLGRNEYGVYCVPRESMHRPAAQRILAGDVWERSTLEYLMKICAGGDVVHAGTYFGDFLPALSKACSPGQAIWAFEPNPINHQCAAQTVVLNDLRNVNLMNAALGDAETTAMMLVKGTQGRHLGGASRVTPEAEDAPPGHAIDVSIVQIDEVVPEERSVSLIQLDVEGYELEALSGALRTIQRCRPILVLESLPDQAWFKRVILSLGYKVDTLIEANTVFCCAL